MASPGINSIVKSKQQHDQRDVRGYDYDHRPQLIRRGHFRGKKCRDAQIKPLRRLMAAILSEAVNRFQRNLFQTSLSGRCEFVEAEFWLFKDDSEALFSFNNVSDVLSLDPRHIRRQLSVAGGPVSSSEFDGSHCQEPLGQRLCQLAAITKGPSRQRTRSLILRKCAV